MLADPFLLDYILAPIAFAIILLYHVYLLIKYKRDPESTIMGFNHRVRALWVQSMMRGKRDILAVQTLRNNMMATSLFASSSILIASALAALTSTSDRLSPINEFVYGTQNTALSMVKLIIIITCFLCAFLCFLQSMRYLNHINLCINIEGHSDIVSPEFVTQVYRRAADYHSLGVRGYFIAFPALLWLFGPIPMLIASVLLTALLFHLDKYNKKGFQQLGGDSNLQLTEMTTPAATAV
ncbi:hypothetical protein HK102_005741 [Quaeritorhiza haematococci]|nr:hypothetical protein HK102_005741 [Quaeritorhiza haematococci]